MFIIKWTEMNIKIYMTDWSYLFFFHLTLSSRVFLLWKIKLTIVNFSKNLAYQIYLWAY
jgi:hypothetical protein